MAGLKLSRDQLAQFLKNHEQIKQFENLFAEVDGSSTALEVVAIEAANASAKANLIDGLRELVEQALIESGNANAGLNNCLNLINAISNDLNLTPSSILDLVAPLISAVTLQKAYNSSTDPEILTDFVRQAFSVKIGTGSNFDYVYEGINTAGTPTFRVNGFGDVTGRQLNGVTLTNAGTGLNLLADDGAYYDYTIFAAPLQNSYNGSIPPEILTAPGIDAVIFRRGTFADTDDVIVVQNNAGTVKFAVTGNGVITGGGSNGINITSDGRLYGTALHNNAGAVTGATNQYIASGTYTPTLTNVTNVAASTARLCTWSRLGNSVTVSGQLDIDLTTTLLASEVGMSLPIPSALTTAFQLGGTANSTSSQSIWGIQADATNDRAKFKATGIVPVTNDTYTFLFQYEVL